MIKRILNLLMEERILDKNEIARRVGVQEETMDDIIRLLLQRGLLRTEIDGCDENSVCSDCHSSAGCETATTGHAFFVTEKGKSYARMTGGSR